MDCKKYCNNFIFGLCFLSLITAGVLQFFMTYTLDDQCDPNIHVLTTGSTVAGCTIITSMFFNMWWVGAKRRNYDTMRRIGMLLWGLSLCAVLATIGASLGQVQVYQILSDAGNTCLTSSDVDFNTIQYASLALVIFSIVVPHVFLSKAKNAGRVLDGNSYDEMTVARVSGNRNAGLTTKKPLVFV